MENLTKEEIDFVVDGLNAYFHQANNQLATDKFLSNRQIKNLEEIKTKSKEIMKKLGAL